MFCSFPTGPDTIGRMRALLCVGYPIEANISEHTSAEVFEQYLQVLGGRPTEELRSSDFFERCLEVFLEKERREGTTRWRA